MQEVRSWRTRVVKPGPPSKEYLLRKLLSCDCGVRMHGTRGSATAVRRYVCSTRRYGNACGEPIVKAEPLESQLGDWIRTFAHDEQLRDLSWEHGGAIVAVRPRAGFAPYFEAAQKQQRHRTERCGAEGGSDGGQTPT